MKERLRRTMLALMRRRHRVGTAAVARSEWGRELGRSATAWYPADESRAAIARGSHPLVVYLPSWGGARAENSVLLHHLASCGYLAVAVDDDDAEPAMRFSSAPQIAQTQRRADAKAERGARATSALLSAILASPFGASVAPERIAIAGFSFGGALAAETAARDVRVRAAINLDGWMFGASARTGVPKPYLVIGTGADDGSDPADALARAFDTANADAIAAGLARHGGFFIEIDGSRHASFRDPALQPVLLGRRNAGPTGGAHVHRIVTALCVAFLERYVRDRPTPLFAIGSGGEPPAAIRFDPAIGVKYWRAPERSDYVAAGTGDAPGSPDDGADVGM